MPEATRDERDLLVRVYDQHLRVLGVLRRRRMDVQLAKPPAKGRVLLEGQILIAEEQDEVFGERLLEAIQCRVVERTGQVDPRDLGTDDRRDWINPQCWRHGSGRSGVRSD